MPTNRSNKALAQLVSALQEHKADSSTDGQLLRNFLSQRDESAFAAVVRRHAPMVHGVCLRLLRNAADAEDAFQATFLVLVRKAHALKSRAVLGDWLHGVARRTALKAKAAAARRRAKEQEMTRTAPQSERRQSEWLLVLDDVLRGLPEKYRLPIILCELEGKTRQQAARCLGWPEGTVSGRLARAKMLLAKRLVGRGVALPGGTLTTAFAANEISASVPMPLVSSTIKAALLVATGQAAAETVVSAKVVALTGEVMKAMLFSKLKSATVVLFVCVIGGFGWLSYGSLAEQPDNAGRLDEKKPARTVRAVNEVSEAQGKVSAPEPEIGNVGIQDRANSRELIARLRDMVDATLFNQQPMTLKEFIGLMYDVFQKKGKALPVMVDAAAFREENPKAESILEAQIQFQLIPRQATVATMFSQALSQLPERNATVLVRDGVVIITTQKRAGLAHLLREKVSATFDNSPLPEVLQDISEMTGVSIILDPRGAESKTRISAAFLNDVTLGAAIRIVADLAGLKVVNMHSGLYLTTPDNAKELERELREAKE